MTPPSGAGGAPASAPMIAAIGGHFDEQIPVELCAGQSAGVTSARCSSGMKCAPASSEAAIENMSTASLAQA